MVEGGDQAGFLGAHQAVAENIAGHIANTHGGEFFALAVVAEFGKVTFDGLPRAAGGNTHRLVVVANRAAGCERIAQPEPILGADRVCSIRECGSPLIGGNHQVVVVTVAGDHALRAYYGFGAVGSNGEVIGHIQQGADKDLVGFATLGNPGVAVHGGIGQLLGIETTLGTGRNNNGILDHLRLDQAQNLGAEVVAAVGPAQTATRHIAKAQVHTFHTRGVYENLELGVRKRRKIDLLGRNLERKRFSTQVCVGAQNSLENFQERAQVAIGVQGWNLVEFFANLLQDFFALSFALLIGEPIVRVEASVEELDVKLRDLRVRHQRI